MRTFITITPLFLFACGSDLPDGWEAAEEIENITQSECEGDPYADEEEAENSGESLEASQITAEVDGTSLKLNYNEAVCRCEQAVEGVSLVEDSKISVLVQPENMNPSQVAKCDCMYDIEITIPQLTTGEYDLEFFQRRDNYGGEAEMVLVETLAIEIE